MKRVKATVGFSEYCGVAHEEVFEFDDDVTIKEIDEAIWDWAAEYLDVDYEVLEDKEEEE